VNDNIAFDLWERANAGRVSDVDAGGEQASMGMDSAFGFGALSSS
jgi:hypothetical protein